MKLIAIGILVGLCTAATFPLDHVQHERRDASDMWRKRGNVDASVVLPMRIGLSQTNLERGHDMLMDVSNPDSSSYGQHYSADEITDLFAPSHESVHAVRTWLTQNGIHQSRVSQSVNKQWLQLDATTDEVQSLLQTKFHTYEHVETGHLSVGCDEYFVPGTLVPHIDYITPGVKSIGITSANVSKKQRRYGSSQRQRRQLSNEVSGDSLQHCSTIITPACIKSTYNISDALSALAGNNLGIFEDEAEYVNQEDLDIFYSLVSPNIPNGTFPIVRSIDGAVNINKTLAAGPESQLDFQIAYPLIYPQQAVLFLTDDDYYEKHRAEKGGFFNTFLDAIDGSYCNYTAFGETGDSPIDPQYPDPHKGGYKGQLQCGVYKPTNVLSFSFGFAEFQTETPANYQRRQCNEYMKLGLQGVSVVFSSGDYGVASAFGCLNKTIFNPSFPANCPYVTSVGATFLTGNASVGGTTETATTNFASGGGFSNFFPRPSYQDSAIEAYFNSPAYSPSELPSYTGADVGNGLFNRSGRGIPDVSALGQYIVSVVNNYPFLVDGTSAATPIFAAILNRINEERLKAGKSTIGFVNPVLYQNPQVFNDITIGHNPGCGSKGFNASAAWDPVTGLGTPKYEKLLDLFMGLK